jgi:hypothetical protein
MASPAVATSSDGTEHKGHVLRLGFDLGTGHLSIDGQHVQDDQPLDTIPLALKSHYGGIAGASIKQIAINGEENVIYGLEDVNKAIRDNPELRDLEFERFKLALHEDFADLDEVKHVKSVLHSDQDHGAIEIFYSDLILEDVKALYKLDNHAGMDSEYWKTIPVELQISVPAMWTDDARGVIRNAARRGGASRAELREEPLCIATAYLVKMAKRCSIKVGQCLLLIDCGQGTLEIATVKLIREPSAGQNMELQRVGNCSGSGAGSHKVSTAAEKWLLSGSCKEIVSRGGFDETCRQLGITKREFLRDFSDGIDTAKVDIDKNSVFDVRVYGRRVHVAPDTLYMVTISIPRTLLMSWYTTWTAPAKTLLEDHLSTQSGQKPGQFAWALFTGGGAESLEFRTQMKSVLEKYKIQIGRTDPYISACSSGALIQHAFQEDSLPPVVYFYISQTEEYVPAIHNDASGNHNTIFQSEYDASQFVVRDRLRQVMRPPIRLPHLKAPDSTPDETGLISEGYIPQTFYVEAAGVDARIHVHVFWSLTKKNEHSALRDAQNVRFDHIHPYQLIFMDAVDFGEHGFEVQQNNNGKRHYVVEGFVRMKSKKDSLVLKVHLMKAHYVLPQKWTRPSPKKKGWTTIQSEEAPFEKEDLLETVTEEVWHKDCSHFVSSHSTRQ